MILEEWMMSDIYSVNKKVKDGSKIESSSCSYPCIVIWYIYISANYLTLLQTHIMFYSSPRLPDMAHRLADIPQKSSRCYPWSSPMEEICQKNSFILVCCIDSDWAEIPSSPISKECKIIISCFLKSSNSWGINEGKLAPHCAAPWP